MVQSNLVKNSIAAYFAAIEIHNKPNISYRYETVTLLMQNAWELALKAYIRKNIKHRSIFSDKEHTISLDKALGYVAEDINGKVPNSFEAIKRNIEEIEVYRNGITHFYCDELEPYIFMLVARSALNYVEFMKKYFSKDIMEDDGLFIMPLGFKLPFRPEDFLSGKVAKYTGSPESIIFIRSIVKTIQELDAAGIEDSIVLGFDIDRNDVVLLRTLRNMAILADDLVYELALEEIRHEIRLVVDRECVLECVEQLREELVCIHLDMRVHLLPHRVSIDRCEGLWISCVTLRLLKMREEGLELCPSCCC